MMTSSVQTLPTSASMTSLEEGKTACDEGAGVGCDIAMSRSNALQKCGRLRTAVVGSWPKPSSVYVGNPGHSGGGGHFIEGVDFDEATREAIRAQEHSGVDIISDGEQRRGSYVFYHVREGFSGVDFEKLTEHVQRAGSEVTMAPTVTGPIRVRKQGFLAAEYIFAASCASKPVQVSVPGPMTILDTVHDDYYNDEQQMCKDIVEALRVEIDHLVDAGCRYLMIDEPVLVRYPEKAKAYGLSLLDELIAGLDIYTAIHLCCSYPTCPKKADNAVYTELAPQLAQTNIQGFSVEHAWRELDLANVLTPLAQAGKNVHLGVVSSNEEVETVDEIVCRVNAALQYIGRDQLVLSPDCGLVCTSAEAAQAKLNNLVAAAARLNSN